MKKIAPRLNAIMGSVHEIESPSGGLEFDPSAVSTARAELRALLAVARAAKKAKSLLDRHSARLLNVDEMLDFISEIEAVSARLSRVSGKGDDR